MGYWGKKGTHAPTADIWESRPGKKEQRRYQELNDERGPRNGNGVREGRKDASEKRTGDRLAVLHTSICVYKKC